ncbi:hypothetical protein [Aureimonas glaciei]|uniref:Uncharacterized protein n=1 Tax=Aureimonas glaciei TaxID=1776957 RepID=A0A916XXU6_9HYPH|nr:hypothetical protein [Aureimonas glaciei]GGD20015.1 hypothetical protein GCM10011335_23670 [Aureimonas glaciei]
MPDSVEIYIRLLDVGERAARVQSVDTGKTATVSLVHAEVTATGGYHRLTLPRRMAVEAGLV